MTVDSENGRTPESYSDEELIEYHREQWEDSTRLPNFTSEEYDPTPARLRTTSFIKVYEDIESARAEQLREILQGDPLIDLGGGLTGWPDELLDKFGIAKYINVDLQHGVNSAEDSRSRRESRSQDLLEALLALPSDSVNVTSNGVLMGDWFHFAANPQWYQNSPSKQYVGIEQAYLKRLFQSIHRVLPDNGVFMAYPNAFSELAEQNGLRLDRNLSTFTSGPTHETVPSLKIYRRTTGLGNTAK